MNDILDPKFKYRPSFDTDVAKTIKREQERLKALRDEQQRNAAEAEAKVEQIPRRKVR